jgi:hypothetical protein
MTTTIQRQVLINARALIAEPSHWTTGTLACNAEGHPVAWHDGSARKWCAQGAIYRAAYDLIADQNKALRLGNEVVRRICSSWWLSGTKLPAINDMKGHAAVLAAFDKALQAA